MRADTVGITDPTDGLVVAVGQDKVRLSLASPHAFLLRFVSGHAIARKPSIYLSGQTWPKTAFKVIQEGKAVGIQTTFGALLVNAETSMWMLRDASGATLTDWASLNAVVTGSSTGPFRLETGGSPKVAVPLFYGSGNTPQRGLLTQTEVAGQTGNGVTGLPQYWSSAGYGALMIGRDDNAPASWKADAKGSVAWTVHGWEFDLYLMPAPTLYDWSRAQAELTGFAPVPPRWAFGYMQSRWGWESKKYIDETFAHFRRDKLPVDVFIFDFEWYTVKPDYEVKAPGDPAFVDFSWNPKLLPKPAKQIADFQKQGLQIVGIRKPRLGNSENLVMARTRNWIIQTDLTDPKRWAPSTRNLIFSREDVRKWWAKKNRKFLGAGMAGFWNDEGEATFTDYSYWNLAEVDLMREVDPSARFWSLNRSFAPGLQRFGAAAWTGDIGSDWATFARTPGELLSFGLSGMPYSACDIGGFFGEENGEETTRWMEAGVFFPVMRSHSEIKNKPHFPWLAGPEHENARRKALNLRYQLVPYYNSLAHQTYRTGAPWMRPLVMEFPADEKVFGMTDEWLMGRGLLAAPLLNAGGARTVYLPADTWYRFGTTQTTQGPQSVNVTAALDEIPVYVRAGTLLPLGPVLQYTGEKTDAPLALEIYPGHNATFDFVQDDGKTRAYQKGDLLTSTFTWNDTTRTLSWKSRGSYHGAGIFHALKAVLYSPKVFAIKSASLDYDGFVTFD